MRDLLSLDLLSDIPYDRPNAVCRFAGPIAIARLWRDEARGAITVANQERAQRRGLRKSPVSEAEIDLLAAFWHYGEHPELQYPVGPYDADFYFPRYRTAIEVDGRHHRDRPLRDQRRDDYLARLGITTIRVGARSVWKNPLAAADGVARDMVAKWIRAA